MPDVQWYGGGTSFTLLTESGTDVLMASGALRPSADDGAALGVSGTAWSDLFLASGGVINFNAGQIAVSHVGGATPYLRFQGGNLRVASAFLPVNSDGAALGSAETMWSDAFFASGAVLNFNNGDVTLTHSADTLTIVGGVLTLPNGSSSAPSLRWAIAADSGFFWDAALGASLTTASTPRWSIPNSARFLFASDMSLEWSPTTTIAAGTDTRLSRTTAGVLELGTTAAGLRGDLRVAGIYAASAYTSVGSVAIASASGYIEIMEQAVPAAGQKAAARLYVDTSAGKRRLSVIFGSGAAQQIAIEP